MKTKFLVTTKGLSYVLEAKDEKQVKRKIKLLKKLGYKKPIVYKKDNQ